MCFCQLVASRFIRMEIGSSDVLALDPMLAADQIQFLPQVAIGEAVGQTLPNLRKLGESPLVGPEWNTVEETFIVAVQENMARFPERLKASITAWSSIARFVVHGDPPTRSETLLSMPQDAGPSTRAIVVVTDRGDGNTYVLHVCSLRC